MNVEFPAIRDLVESAEAYRPRKHSNLLLIPLQRKIAAATPFENFRPDYRFPTSVWTDGQIDRTTGTLYGNLYISGRDPAFNLEHGVAIAYELNRLGIINVTGDLIVTDNFTMNYSSAQRAVTLLQSSIDSSKRARRSARAWRISPSFR